MRYVFASTGQQVEVPLLPGLTLRGDAWYSRAATPGGFNKTQVLAQEVQQGMMVGNRFLDPFAVDGQFNGGHD